MLFDAGSYKAIISQCILRKCGPVLVFWSEEGIVLLVGVQFVPLFQVCVSFGFATLEDAAAFIIHIVNIASYKLCVNISYLNIVSNFCTRNFRVPNLVHDG